MSSKNGDIRLLIKDSRRIDPQRPRLEELEEENLKLQRQVEGLTKEKKILGDVVELCLKALSERDKITA
ncbi:MAG: hypothetical protein ACE5EK_00200 [Nitrospinales bacterium]